jgi:CspA family cold shock protein
VVNSSANKYGFIQPDDSSKDVFFHENDLKKSGMEKIKKDQKVEYQLEGKGTKVYATHIKIVNN